MKKKRSLLKNVLIKNFYHSLEINYKIKDYSKFKKELDIKLLTLRGIIAVYYKQEFLHLIFDELEDFFSYKYDKKIDLIDNLLCVKNNIEKVDDIIQNQFLLEDLVRKITENFGIQYEFIINIKINLDIGEINNLIENEFLKNENASLLKI